jgi:hypothetical protein
LERLISLTRRSASSSSLPRSASLYELNQLRQRLRVAQHQFKEVSDRLAALHAAQERAYNTRNRRHAQDAALREPVGDFASRFPDAMRIRLSASWRD